MQLEISLPLMRFYAFHGVMPQEHEVGGRYEVALRLTVTGAERAVLDDELEATVNYAEVYDVVREVMQTPSRLLEHVAGRTLRAVFSRFEHVEQATVSVTKVAPPIVGLDGGGATVTLTANRSEVFAHDAATNQRYRLLILDFDGTLADSAAGIIATMAATFNELGLPCATDDAVRATIGLPLPQGIAVLTGLEGEALAHAVSTYRRLFEVVGNKEVRLFPTVAETLAAAHEAGMTIAIATSRGHASVEGLCRMLGIDPYIDIYVAEDDVREKKPAPEPVLHILQLTGRKASEALVVGDTTFDIEMGRRAGCTTCGVSYGNHPAYRLFAAGATDVVERFANCIVK